MKFEQGHPKKGGRKAGTPNRNGTDLKARIATLLEEQFETVVADLEVLDPKDRIGAYLKFLDFILPRQKETKIDLSSLSDAEIDDLLNKAMNKLDD